MKINNFEYSDITQIVADIKQVLTILSQKQGIDKDLLALCKEKLEFDF